jgi:dihydroorotate dehydrogenase
MDARDAIEKLEAGAWLLQVYTGFVYNGPTFAGTLCREISAYLETTGMRNIQELRSV